MQHYHLAPLDLPKIHFPRTCLPWVLCVVVDGANKIQTSTSMPLSKNLPRGNNANDGCDLRYTMCKRYCRPHEYGYTVILLTSTPLLIFSEKTSLQRPPNHVLRFTTRRPPTAPANAFYPCTQTSSPGATAARPPVLSKNRPRRAPTIDAPWFIKAEALHKRHTITTNTTSLSLIYKMDMLKIAWHFTTQQKIQFLIANFVSALKTPRHIRVNAYSTSMPSFSLAFPYRPTVTSSIVDYTVLPPQNTSTAQSTAITVSPDTLGKTIYPDDKKELP